MCCFNNVNLSAILLVQKRILKYPPIWVELYYHLDICRVTMSAYVERPGMNLKNCLDLCKCFRAEVSVLVDYVAALLG